MRSVDLSTLSAPGEKINFATQESRVVLRLDEVGKQFGARRVLSLFSFPPSAELVVYFFGLQLLRNGCNG